jgi:hypothetical protein
MDNVILFFSDPVEVVKQLQGVSLRNKDVNLCSDQKEIHDLFFTHVSDFNMKSLHVDFGLPQTKGQYESLMKIAKGIASSSTPTKSLTLKGITLPLPREFMELVGPHLETLKLVVEKVYLKSHPQSFRLNAFSQLKKFFFYCWEVKHVWLKELIESLPLSIVKLKLEINEFDSEQSSLSKQALVEKLGQLGTLSQFSSNFFFHTYDASLGKVLSEKTSLKKLSLRGNVDAQFVKDVVALPYLFSFHCMDTDCPEEVLWPELKRWTGFSWKNLSDKTLKLFIPETLKEFNLVQVEDSHQLFWFAEHFIPRFSSHLKRFSIRGSQRPCDGNHWEKGLFAFINAFHQNKVIENLFLNIPSSTTFNKFDDVLRKLVEESLAISFLMTGVRNERFHTATFQNQQYWIRMNQKRKVIMTLCGAMQLQSLPKSILRNMVLNK